MFEGLLAPWHLLVLAVVVLVVLGPKELPSTARRVGVLLRQFRAFRDELEGELHHAFTSDGHDGAEPGEAAGTAGPDGALDGPEEPRAGLTGSGEA